MNNLKNIRDQRGLTQKQLGDLMHTTDVSISRYEKEDHRLTLPLIRQLATVLECLPEDIIREDGAEALVIRQSNEIEFRGEGYISVPVYDVRFSAGAGALNADHPQPLHHHLYREQWLRRIINSATGEVVEVHVSGDSMWETLHDRDSVLVDRGVSVFTRDGIYAIQVGTDDVQVKRLQRDARTGLITIISDNPQYKPVEGVREGDIRIYGRVIWLGRHIG